MTDPSGGPLQLRISDVAVEVHCELPGVLTGMAAVWHACTLPTFPARRSSLLRVQRVGTGFDILWDGRPLSAVEREEDVLPLLEECLYRAIRSWHGKLVLLHAAGVCRDGCLVLLAGRSGAGKSSLALEALRRGYRYLSDEMLVCDGRHIWGIPRAVQFDVLRDGDELIERLQGADRSSYPLRIHPECTGAVPLFPVTDEQVERGRQDVSQVVVVEIGRGAPSLKPLGPLEALAVLHEAALTPPCLDLGGLLGAGSWQLRWDEPGPALDWLDELAAAAGADF